MAEVAADDVPFAIAGAANSITRRCDKDTVLRIPYS